MTDSTANKAVVQRYLDMWNTGDISTADDRSQDVYGIRPLTVY